MLDKEIINTVRTALSEDIRTGDITTDAIIPYDKQASADFLVKQEGIIGGLEIAEEVFRQVDPDILFYFLKKDSDKVFPGDIAASVKGSAASILKAERTALNFLQRISGIATLSSKYLEEVKHTKAKILDTRKTVPGMRLIDKMGVTIGGCTNHRIGLFDMFLIKDNHIEIAGSITKAVHACREFQAKNKAHFRIEVETKNIDEVAEALENSVDIIMLDNFSIGQMTKAVKFINDRCLIEASGGINLQTIREVAETGVDYISVGALTHSVNALDISLEVKL